MLTQEQIQELEVQHGRIAHVRSRTEGEWEVVLKKPKRSDYKMFRSQSHNSSQAADAQEILVRKMVVYPDADAFMAMLEEYPAIPEACTGAVALLTGLAAAADSK